MIAICVGDMVDGYPGNDLVVDSLRCDPAIRCLKGNHDEIDLPDLRPSNQDWLLALPDVIEFAGFHFSNYSPRMQEEKIRDPFTAWNAFDDADFTNAVVGHAHVRAAWVRVGRT